MSHGSVQLPSFRNGVHPDENKGTTEGLRIERMPFVERYVIPLGQHIGAPSRSIVKVGDVVRRGQMIAEAGGFVSVPQHSPVDGRVTAVEQRRHPGGQYMQSIEIAADAFSSQEFEDRPPIDWQSLDTKTFVSEVQKAGLVGLGGAAFPSHVKYAVPEGKVANHLVLNGCECEPFLTCDHRVMCEWPEAVIRGTEILAARLGVSQTTIGVENNKAEAAEALRQVVKSGQAIDVKTVQVKYPQGAEKMLIQSLFSREVPAGKLPIDIGMVVNNVGTMAAIADWFDRGKPLIERVITVSGPGIKRPSNLLVPIGTPVRDIIDHCGGLSDDVSQIILGGPMMGFTLSSLDAPVLKGTSGILAFTNKETAYPKEYTCIRCARCLEACPLFLNPSRLGKLARVGRFEESLEYHINDCMECAACSYACPSNIPLVHLIRIGKSAIRERAAAEKRASS